MSARLPVLTGYEVVAFHYDPMKNRNVIILQVPTEDFSDSSTYQIRIDKAEDMRYLQSLLNGLRVYDCLLMYGHVGYFPLTGEFNVLKDAYDKPNYLKGHSNREQSLREFQKTAGRTYIDNWKNTVMRNAKQK